MAAALCPVFVMALAGCTHVALSKGPAHSTDPTDDAAVAASVDPLTGMAALFGTDLGAGSTFLIGAAPDKIQQKKSDEARAAAERSRVAPATVDDAQRSDSADLNNDGFVTVDEVVALQKAGFSESQIIDRLQRTGQVFILTEQQKDYLHDRGVSQPVIDAMTAMGNAYARTTGSTTIPVSAGGR